MVLFAAFLFVLDLGLKIAAMVYTLQLSDCFAFRAVPNPGPTASPGLDNSTGLFLGLVGFVGLGIISWFFWKYSENVFVKNAFICLVWSGVAGNFASRLLFGSIVDPLEYSCGYIAFNLADIYLIGALPFGVAICWQIFSIKS